MSAAEPRVRVCLGADPADAAADLLHDLQRLPFGEALARLRAALLAAQAEGAREVRRSYRARLARALL